jgi:hypothetical protein
MKITGFKVLKGGIGGIEVKGIDLVNTGVAHAMFKDEVSRIRKFPLNVQLRNSIVSLNYPFLVGTEHWRSEFAAYMQTDFNRLNRRDEYVLLEPFKRLVTLWEACNILKCELQKESYKITGQILFDSCTIQATVLISPDDDHSLYSFVDERLCDIVKLIDQHLNLPQNALGTGADIREMIHKISNAEEDDIADNLTIEEAYVSLMKTASKKGYSVVMDDNMLSLLSHNIPDTEVEDDVMKLTNVVDAEKVSDETKDGSIFQQEPIEEDII